MLNSNQYTEGGFLLQQPSFDMDHDYGFFEMEDFDDLKDRDENYPCVEDDRSAVEEPSSILTPSLIEQLSLQSDKWECLFSSSRDGPSFGTFMRHVRGHMRTIVVAKAEDGQIYGVYATDAWSGRGRIAGCSDETFLFEVPTSAAKKGQMMSPLAQPSSYASFGSFIPGLDNIMGASPTSTLDFDAANVSSTPKNAGALIDVVKSTSTTSGFKQVCQLGNKFIGVSDGEVSFSIESSFSRGSTQSATQDRKEFDIVEFEVYGLLEG